jgi:hypothetical protein
MGWSKRGWIGFWLFVALLIVLTIGTLVALVVNANGATLSRCLNTQLAVKPGQSNGAAGSIGQVVHFTNVSHAACTLEGYPGMQMLDGAGRPLATEVHRGSSVTVQARPVRLVTLLAGGQASFELGYADATGFGDEHCPSSTRIEVTPPDDFRSLTIAWRLQPYGGDIPHLECGEITVSPVFAGA